MTDNEVKQIINDCYNTVRELLKEGDKEAYSVFRSDKISISVDEGSNNSVYYITDIRIQIFPKEFQQFKDSDRLKPIESTIKDAYIASLTGHRVIWINEVKLYPKSETSESGINNVVISDDFSFWDLGFYRMFISHLSENKVPASNLKLALENYGISCFVAHKDIEPTTLWADEIEKGLRTMQCLCAIITPGFIESKWCDQEVGYALGRNVFVIPIIKGCVPYGIFGKFQGVQSKNKNANKLAEEIFGLLSKDKSTSKTYLRILAELLLNSRNNEDALKWIKLLTILC